MSTKLSIKKPYIVIDLSVYGSGKIFLFYSPKDFEKYHKKFIKNEKPFIHKENIEQMLQTNYDDSGALTWSFGLHHVIVMNREKSERNKNFYIGLLTHELSHAVIELFSYISIPISPDNSETFCYTIQYCLNQVLNKIKFEKKEKRKLKLSVNCSE